ncbi:hypothetical protein EKO04_001451 [Ascochyta lentis]|uniref:Uncharacterized protein n=1 Tax=Ascochyta lentis TaxID=205686 RepID=A0A8H7JBH2_9PLEO|nr:hypothetical protein EKO04_001451 [Ascochyta lentis]
MNTGMDPIDSPPTQPLLDSTTHDLLNTYPNLPLWAINAFFILQQPQGLWTPEARALLNMAYLPPSLYALDNLPIHVEALSEDLKESFESEEGWVKAKEEIDLWRLSRDLVKAKKEGWGQWKGVLYKM